MLALFIKIVLCFVAIGYFIILLKKLFRLAKKSSFIKYSCIISVTAIIIFHHNFFQFHPFTGVAIIKLPNYQILKLIGLLLLIRIPIIVLPGLLSKNANNKNGADRMSGGYRGWQPNLGLRSPDKIVVNGIASLKINKAFICAFLLLLFSGNWMSHHLMLGAVLLCSFYLFKMSRIGFKNLKIC
jgi:hypothetical protein